MVPIFIMEGQESLTEVQYNGLMNPPQFVSLKRFV